jgi:hypothetical protein
MRSIRHPLSGALYDLTTDGTVEVTAPDGRSGRFRSDGTYLSGNLYFADPHLCGWIGGRDLQSRMRPRNASGQDARATNK